MSKSTYVSFLVPFNLKLYVCETEDDGPIEVTFDLSEHVDSCEYVQSFTIDEIEICGPGYENQNDPRIIPYREAAIKALERLIERIKVCEM